MSEGGGDDSANAAVTAAAAATPAEEAAAAAADVAVFENDGEKEQEDADVAPAASAAPPPPPPDEDQDAFDPLDLDTPLKFRYPQTAAGKLAECVRIKEIANARFRAKMFGAAIRTYATALAYVKVRERAGLGVTSSVLAHRR